MWLFSQKNTHSLSTIIETFEKHPSILIIEKGNLIQYFYSERLVKRRYRKLSVINTKKVCQTSNTSTKIIKLNSDIFSNLIYKHFNYCIDKGEFPSDLKHAVIVPVYKKNNRHKKENYKPVYILSNLSKIYERLMYNLLYDYFDNILFPSQCGFRKGYSAQHCLLVMIEKLSPEVLSLVLSYLTFPKHLIV